MKRLLVLVTVLLAGMACSQGDLTDEEARLAASAFADAALAQTEFRNAAGEVVAVVPIDPARWTGIERRDGRIFVSIKPSRGLTVTVSMNPDGSAPEIGEAYYAFR